MKVLVLENDGKARSLIQSAIERSGHEMISAASIEEALKPIGSGQIRFVIADVDGANFDKQGLIRRIRESIQPPVYFLMLTSTENESADFDDTLFKPFTLSELKARIMIGQRFLSLGDNLSQAREQIDNLALYDSLTGLMNRGAFYRTAEGELERARRASSPLSVIALDLDNFKVLNNAYGTETGDEVLKVVAQTVREKSRPYDCIGRWSGDEFIIALPSVIGGDAEKIAERIIKGVRSTQITSKNIILNVGVSAGIASAQRISAATEVDALIEQARRAVARAKEMGGNQVNVSYV
jgi:two-component system cell cycle response regulator